MAQLNPNFEIDYSDINSYEQIQLINDTQLAKENLLMHRAYKEPSDDEIIRNRFSSFTFVDFCPKLFSALPSTTASGQQQTAEGILNGADSNNRSLRYYELETFSDLFERINSWLKLNKDWRVVSMETLVYDCTSHFNQLKSSIYSSYLPQNTRGLRLFLSPSKSRFSGPQKIGCINVVPRKISGSHTDYDDPPVYETLDQILQRLNELLLTRPIEGRILSVETITLPMVNGYVNTESNYFMDSRLNILNQNTYNVGNQNSPSNFNCQNQVTDSNVLQGHNLIDILRVYYEFGPVVCGLVNLIDFIPRFYSSANCNLDPSAVVEEAPDNAENGSSEPKSVSKIAPTESLTRLIRRSLAWFESERKRILEETTKSSEDDVTSSPKPVNLRVCNLQVHHKTILKSQLIQINSNNALESISTRVMAHNHMMSSRNDKPIVCVQCSTSTDSGQDMCAHLLDLIQPYHLKFTRLAYVVPVYNKYAHSVCSLRPLRPYKYRQKAGANQSVSFGSRFPSSKPISELSDSSSSTSSESSSPSDSSPYLLSPEPTSIAGEFNDAQAKLNQQVPDTQQVEERAESSNEQIVEEPLEGKEEGRAKQAALSIVDGTNERHRLDEEANQLNQVDDGLNDSPIGQLTYRLFAPCQLVNSSSCFSINPVNSSSPLARRGSVDLNGSGISSENAHPSTLLLGSSSSGPSETQQVITSFGAFFPALSHDIMHSTNHPDNNSSSGNAKPQASKFTTNEFEPVEAIKRRMEIYVTTNSMKVIAGETLIVNLSDVLSCLSTAIEQTVAKASFAQRAPTTWVSVYVLYAAVEEPQLPDQLLAQQKLRELTLIDEEGADEEEELPSAEGLFDDEFNSSSNVISAESIKKPAAVDNVEQQSSFGDGSIRIEHNPIDSSLTLYNSAYDRTVALPSQPEPPDNLDESEFIIAQEQGIEIRGRKKRKRKAKHEDSQCSIM